MTTTKGEHEKPQAVDDEHQPIVKKVRLDVDNKMTEDVKKVKIDEHAAPQREIGSHEDTVEKHSSASTSPVGEEEEQDVDVVETTEEDTKKEKEATPNTTGSAFGGFSAFCGTNAFKQFTTSNNADAFTTKVLSDSCVKGHGINPSSGFGGAVSSSSSDAATNSLSGFASFQNNSSVTFASFAAAPTATEGFGEKTSSSSIDFLDVDVVKKADPIVSALSEAESYLQRIQLANGEEGELILVEKRAKLFKLVEKDYVEVGIGPLRVLNAKDAKPEENKLTARIVMRRESYPHGPGTKLLMNASLGSCVLCEKKTEKTMMLTVLEATEDSKGEKEVISVTYLTRFGSPDDLDVVSGQIHMLTSAAMNSLS
ncbi:hypothetical protein PsorP6_015168 [Peronosclerospora sorghi]|uniref:Uncharacterized protein n=1 Tax=Peronosclerospora sorghi TaxID=230839 RepID=A0ACC0VUR8_9STRA|nr:hypothetical protein PsorP6_015168 [Peronosclerospora sorghi]